MTRESPAVLFPTARTYFRLVLAVVAFAVYGSLLPFDFDPVPLDRAWSEFRATVFSSFPARFSRSDALANVLLFCPFGFALAGSLLVDRPRRVSVVVPAVLAILPVSVAVSLCSEFLQTFATARVPSNVDIAAQTFGCVAGVIAWVAVGQPLTVWLRDAWAAGPADRQSRLLMVFAVGWMFINLAPFDITVDVGDLGARVRSGQIALSPYDDPDIPPVRHAWDAIAEVLSAVPLGLLALAGWNRHTARSPGMAVFVGVGLVVCVEAAQVFIASHSAHGMDALFGSVGVAAGVVLGRRFMPVALHARSTSGTVVSAPAALLTGFWCVLLLAYHWLPYDFALDTAAISDKLARLSLLPFAGYARGSYVNAFNDLLLKIALSAPLGICAAFVVRGGGLDIRVLTIAWLLLAVCVFAVVEAGQLFLPTRVPDPTDVLVGTGASYLGLRLGRWVQHQSANVHRHG